MRRRLEQLINSHFVADDPQEIGEGLDVEIGGRGWTRFHAEWARQQLPLIPA